MEITIETSKNVLSALISKAVVEGSLTIDSVNCLNYLLGKAQGEEILSKENEVLKAKVEELETLLKK